MHRALPYGELRHQLAVGRCGAADLQATSKKEKWWRLVWHLHDLHVQSVLDISLRVPGSAGCSASAAFAGSAGC